MLADSAQSGAPRGPELWSLLGAIVESSSDVIVSKDLNGIVTSWNRSAERTFGFTAEEAIGRSIVMIIPADRLDEERVILERIRRGERISHFRTVRQRKDGSLLDFSATISPVRDARGMIVGASKVGRDISAEKRAECALIESEARYRQLAEQISDGIFRAGPDRRFVDCNSAGLEMFGYTREELMRLHVSDLLAPSEWSRLPEQFEALSAGRVVQNEWNFQRKDGSTFVGELSGRELPDGGYQSVLRDVTARVLDERERRKTAALLSTILESTPDHIWVKDADGRFTLGNRSTLEFFGGSEPEHVLGRAASELIVNEEITAPVIANDRKVLESGQHQTAEEVFGEVTLHTYRAPLHDSQGKISGLVGISRDISRQKRIERELRESEERFRLLAEIGPFFVWILDQEGTLEYANQRVQSNSRNPFVTPGSVGQIEHMLHPMDRDKFHHALQQALENAGALELEARFQLREGSSAWCIIRGVPFTDPGSRKLRWFVTATDIEQQKAVQEELRRLNSDLEQFAHSASHDLQEPLRSIIIYSQLLRRKLSGSADPESKGYLDDLQNGAARMSELLSGLLAYVQASRSGKPLTADVDAGACLEKTLVNLSQAITEANAEIVSTKLPVVSVAAVHLEQLFQNLLSNAIKYSRKDVRPRIEVSARPGQAEWVFSVRDNGIGISPEYREQVFGLFKRLHTHDEYAGAGIGLALCARVVERYQGRIWVESEPGGGSVFFFTLPGSGLPA